jgi:hypothetical protein
MPQPAAGLLLIAWIALALGMIYVGLAGLFTPMIIVDRSLPPLQAWLQSRRMSMSDTSRVIGQMLLASFACVFLMTQAMAMMVVLGGAVLPKEFRLPPSVQYTFWSLWIIPFLAIHFCYYKELEVITPAQAPKRARKQSSRGG